MIFFHWRSFSIITNERIEWLREKLVFVQIYGHSTPLTSHRVEHVVDNCYW